MIAAAAAAACDQGKQHDQPTAGPYVEVLGANVGPSNALATDGVVRIAFDRLLNPRTVTRQAVTLRDASGAPVSSPLPLYDPVARVVTLASPVAGDGGAASCWLMPKQPYKVTLSIAQGTDDNSGLRAIDGATLDPAGMLEIAFMTGSTPCSSSPPPIDPAIDFCTDILYPIFASRCSGPFCHGSPQMVSPSAFPQFPDGLSKPAAGLVLQDSQGVQQTALPLGGRAAQGSNTGPLAGHGESPGHIFGVDMPIIDPGSPGNSWLMYKLMLAEPPGEAGIPSVPLRCALGVVYPVESMGMSLVPLGNISPGQPLPDSERQRLSNFILGREMPFPSAPGSGDPVPANKTLDNPTLSVEELERVRAWIASLSPTAPTIEDCSSCSVIPGDAGAPETGPGPEGGADAPADAPVDAPADAPPDAPRDAPPG